MEQYRLTQTDILAAKRAFVLTRLLWLLCATVSALVLSYLAFRWDWWICVFQFVVVVAAAIVVLIPATRQYASNLASYQLIIDDTAISCEQNGSARVSILLDKITLIRIHRNGNIEIRTNKDPLFIPSRIENRQEILVKLPAHIPRSNPMSQLWLIIPGLALVGGSVGVLQISRDRTLIIAASLFLIVLSLWGFYDICRRDRRVRILILAGFLAFWYSIVSRLLSVFQ